MQTIKLTFVVTRALQVRTNTCSKFDAKLKDNLGIYDALVTLNADDTVNVTFEGAPHRKNLQLDYARWEFSTIWDDLDRLGHKVLVINNK